MVLSGDDLREPEIEREKTDRIERDQVKLSPTIPQTVIPGPAKWRFFVEIQFSKLSWE
jgi:hypothetical protein